MIGKKTQKGFALYLTVITVGVISLITFALSDIAFRQNTIASIGNKSQQAFYASNSGLDCALFWDLHYASFPYVTSTDSLDIECGDGVTLEDSEENGNSVTTTLSISYDKIDCNVRVEVEKTVERNNDNEIEKVNTKITSRGESGSCVSGDANRFQRSIEVNY